MFKGKVCFISGVARGRGNGSAMALKFAEMDADVAIADVRCDIRVADECAIFGFPEDSLGVIPGAGGTQRLTRLVGSGKAKEIIFTGDPINVAEAKSIGLVERVVNSREAVSEAKKIASRILLRGPIAIRNAKKAINEGVNMNLKDGLKREAQLFSELFNTQDLKEGTRAFLEKRKPNLRVNKEGSD